MGDWSEEDFLVQHYGYRFAEDVKRWRSHRQSMLMAWAQDAAQELLCGFHPPDCPCGLQNLPNPVRFYAVDHTLQEIMESADPHPSSLMAELTDTQLAFEVIARHPSLPKHIEEGKRLYGLRQLRINKREEALLSGKGAARFNPSYYQEGDYEYPLMEALMEEDEPLFWDHTK